MKNSVIIQAVVRLFGFIRRSWRTSVTKRASYRAMQVLADSARTSAAVRGTKRAYRSLSRMGDLEGGSVFLRTVNNISSAVLQALFKLYAGISRVFRFTVCHALYRNFLRPIDGVYNALYTLAVIGCGFLTVVILKNLVLLRFGLQMVAYLVLLAVLALIVMMGDKLRAALQESIFVRLFATLLK